jgi:hypothetical protein
VQLHGHDALLAVEGGPRRRDVAAVGPGALVVEDLVRGHGQRVLEERILAPLASRREPATHKRKRLRLPGLLVEDLIHLGAALASLDANLLRADLLLQPLHLPVELEVDLELGRGGVDGDDFLQRGDEVELVLSVELQRGSLSNTVVAQGAVAEHLLLLQHQALARRVDR